MLHMAGFLTLRLSVCSCVCMCVSVSKISQKILNRSTSFLALLCATAHQSYCCHTGVRRPSVRPSVCSNVRVVV